MGCLERRLQSRVRVEYAAEAEFGKFLLSQFRSEAAEHDVGDLRHGKGTGNLSQFIGRGWCLDESHVGASLNHGARPVDRRLQPEDRTCVGTCHDLQVAVATRVDSGFDLRQHFLQRHDLLAVEMAALSGHRGDTPMEDFLE
jgi:hypothetical protein